MSFTEKNAKTLIQETELNGSPLYVRLHLFTNYYVILVLFFLYSIIMGITSFFLNVFNVFITDPALYFAPLVFILATFVIRKWHSTLIQLFPPLSQTFRYTPKYWDGRFLRILKLFTDDKAYQKVTKAIHNKIISPVGIILSFVFSVLGYSAFLGGQTILYGGFIYRYLPPGSPESNVLSIIRALFWIFIFTLLGNVLWTYIGFVRGILSIQFHHWNLFNYGEYMKNLRSAQTRKEIIEFKDFFTNKLSFKTFKRFLETITESIANILYYVLLIAMLVDSMFIVTDFINVGHITPLGILLIFVFLAIALIMYLFLQLGFLRLLSSIQSDLVEELEFFQQELERVYFYFISNPDDLLQNPNWNNLQEIQESINMIKKIKIIEGQGYSLGYWLKVFVKFASSTIIPIISAVVSTAFDILF